MERFAGSLASGFREWVPRLFQNLAGDLLEYLQGVGVFFVCQAQTNEERTWEYAAATSEEGNDADGKNTSLPERRVTRKGLCRN